MVNVLNNNVVSVLFLIHYYFKNLMLFFILTKLVVLVVNKMDRVTIVHRLMCVPTTEVHSMDWQPNAIQTLAVKLLFLI